MYRKEIAPGVFYTALPGEYKKSRITVVFRFPLERESITSTAFLPYLLERGTKKCPDMTALKRRCNALWGANLGVASMMYNDSRLMLFSVSGVDETYLKGVRGLSRRRASLLTESIFDANISDGAFPKDWLEIEGGKLKDRIRAAANNKRGYSLQKAYELFFGKDLRGLPSEGFLEEVDLQSEKSLASHYRSILSCSDVEIFDAGRSAGELECFFSDAFAGRAYQPGRNVGNAGAVPYGPIREGSETFEVEQDKIAEIWTTGQTLSEREQTALRVASALAGSMPTSRFFLNIREKQSLCYYCSCRAGLQTGTLSIESGVSPEHAEALCGAVRQELGQLAHGDFSAEELADAKRYLNNMFRSACSSAEGAVGWYLNALFRTGRLKSPEEEIADVESLDANEVAGILSLMQPGARFRLKGKGLNS